MARDIGNLALQDKTARFQRTDRRQRHRHQRRLGVRCQCQILFRTLPNEGRQFLPESLVDLLEHRLCLRKRLGQIAAHADSLAALAGKGKCY
jgi:hypothetical protein